MKRILLMFGILIFGISNAQITAPMTESFNSTTLPAGWNVYNTTGTNWQLTGTNNSVNCAAAQDHTGNSGTYIWHDQSGTDAGVVLEMDTVDVSALTTPYLEFFYWMCGVGYTPPNSTIVEAYDGAGSWLLVDSIGTSTNGWEAKGYNISTFTYGANKVLIRFRSESGGSTSDFYGDNAIDDVRIITEPLCPRPSNLAVNNITATTADASWNVLAAATSYKLISGLSGFNPSNSGTVNTASNNSFSLSSLSGNTLYDLYLVANCGAVNGESDTVGPVSFRTACVPEVIGYNNDFEADLTNNTPFCWSNYISGTNGSTNVITFSNPNSGSQHVDIANGFAATTDTIMLITPKLAGLTSSNNQIRFFGKGSSANVELILGSVSSDTMPQTFAAFDTIRFATANAYEEFIIPITTTVGYNGTDEYLAFKHSNTATFTDAYIDDFNYEAIPPCPQITGVNIINVGPDSVVISYTSSGTTIGYEWGPVGFAQGTGTVGTSNGNPLVVTGLASATSFDIYLQNDCSGSGNGTSVWVGPFTFQTTCLAQTLPFTEDFNFGVGCFSPINIGGTSVGWEHQPTGGSNQFGDLDGTPYMIADSDQHANGIHMISDMETPPIDAGSLSTGASLVVEWDQYFNSSNAGDSGTVEVYDGSNWVVVWSNQADLGAFGAPDHQFIDITAYANANLKVRFHYDDNNIWAWYWAVDNVTVREISCLEPTNLGLISRTSSSAIIGWNAGGGAAATNVEFGLTGYAQGTGISQITMGNSDTLTGLLPNTTYDVYVQDSCGSAGGNSLWVGPFTFTTRCVISPANLPLNDGFESYATGPYQAETDFCNPTYIWEYTPTVSQGRLRVAAGAGFANTGVQAATLDNSLFVSPATTNYLTLNVDLSNYTTSVGIELSFSILNIAQEGNPDNRVWVRGSNSDPWIEIVNLDNSTTSGSFVNISNIDIVGPLSNAGQAVGTETQIRWGQSGVSSAFSTTFSDGYSIDDVSLVEVTCPTPSGLTIGNLSDTSGTLSWNTNASASNYEVWFGPQGFSQGSNTVGGARVFTGGTASLLVDTMSPNTCYEYLLRYVCGPGDSSFWAGPFSFCTPCSPFTAPYFQNYDAMIANSTPDCWTSLVEGSSTAFTGTFVTNFNALSTPNTMELDNGSGGNTIIAVSPLFGDMDAGDKRVNFWARQSFAGGAEIIVGTIDNPTSSLGFNPLDTILLTGTYDEFVVNLDAANGYNGTDKFVAIMHGNLATFQTIYVDDFLYETIPTCPKPPTASISVQSVGITSAELEWDAGTAGNLDFEISYGPAISLPNQGITMVVSGDSALLNGLIPNTQYCYFVREICGPGDTSVWSLNPVCFTTLCNAFTAPYFQDFEGPNTPVGHWDGTTDCWDYASNNPGFNGSGGYSWEVRNTAQTTSGTGTGPDRDNTLAPAIGGKFITADVSGSSTVGPDSTILSSPSIDISGLLTPEFEFYYHMHGTNMADLHVDIWNGTTWDRDVIVITGTHNISQADPYNDTIYDLASYAGQTDLRVRFRALTNGCCSGDIAIDDIRISDPVNCVKPANLSSANITGSGAKLIWDSGSGATNANYEVSYGVNISSPSAGISSLVSGDSTVLTGLTDATVYCYFVREICGPGDSSAWTGPHCFQTLCLLQTLPYSENFNLNEGCMSLLNVGFTAVGWEPQPAGGANQFGDLDGTGYMIADSDQHANGIHMIVDMETPIIDASNISPGKILAVEWDQYFNSINAGDSGAVQVYDGTNWVTVWSNQNDLGAFGSPDHPIVDVTAYANASFQVRFRYDDNNIWAWYWAVDNLLVSERIPNCDPPINVFSSQVDCNQIELTWTSNSGGSIIEYGAAGFTPGTGTYTGIVTSPSFVTALSPLTSYDFYIADTCGNDTSAWFGPFNESTIACPAGCLDPTGLDTASATCTSAILTWVSGPTTVASVVEWGPSGFIPGTGAGTIVANATNPLPISGLTAGTAYDFYVLDFCATDTSNVVGPMSFTTPSGPITASFVATPGSPSLTNLIVNVDATNSVGASSYTWDWGDGTPTSTVSSSTTFHSYSANGGYNIKLIITGDCGTDSISQVVNVAGISIAENALGRSMQLYPNPTVGLMNLRFESEASSAVISVLDLTGKTIMQINESNLIGGKYDDQLDISHLAKGTYVLKVESGDLSVQRRIVKR